MSKARIVRTNPAKTSSPIIKASLDWWQMSGGVIDAASQRLQEIYSRTIIALDCPESWPPPFLSVGPDTLMAYMWGEDCARQAPGGSHLPDKTLDDQVVPLYREVSSLLGPASDFVTASMSSKWGAVRINYERLILPARLKNGRAVFLTATQLHRMVLLPEYKDGVPSLRGTEDLICKPGQLAFAPENEQA